MMITTAMLQESAKEIQKLINDFEEELEAMPPGVLLLKKRGRKYSLYHRMPGDCIVCLYESNPENLMLINQLRRKFCIKNMLPGLYLNLSTINEALLSYVTYDPIAITREMHPAYKTSPWFFDGIPANQNSTIDQQLAVQILNDAILADNKDFYPEKLQINSGLGFDVRSKSKYIIANTLHNHGIPFKYEAEILINGKTLRPDFLIVDSHHQLVIWEHFGMMDSPDYAKISAVKVTDYLTDGYIIGETLFITSETKNRPLDYTSIAPIIRKLAG